MESVGKRIKSSSREPWPLALFTFTACARRAHARRLKNGAWSTTREGRRARAGGARPGGQTANAQSFVSHDENAIPILVWRLEHVILATLPIGSGRAVVRPAIQHFLEHLLSFAPVAAQIAGAGT